MWHHVVVSHPFKVLCFLQLIFVISCVSIRLTSTETCDLTMIPCFEDYEYFQDGDIIIGGVFTVNRLMHYFLRCQMSMIDYTQCMLPQALHYKNLLTFIHEIDGINSDPEILPNITLGYHVFDSCSDGLKAVKSILQILSGPGQTIPNYSCNEGGKLVGVIGDHYSITTIPMAQILGVYKYTQISYGTTSFQLTNRNLFPTTFRTLQNDHTNYSALSKLLKHFGWNWIGILASDDASGDEESQVLTKYTQDDGICVSYIIKTNQAASVDHTIKSKKLITKSKAQVIVLCGSFSVYSIHALTTLRKELKDKTLVFGPTWALNIFFLHELTDIFNGSLALEMNADKAPDIHDHVHPYHHPEDRLLEDIWLNYFKCLSKNQTKNRQYIEKWRFALVNCTGKERITNIISFRSGGGHYPQIIHALQALAYVLNTIYLSANMHPEAKKNHISNYKFKLHHYMRKQKVLDSTEKRQLFNDNGEYITWYRVMNWKALASGTRASLVCIGYFDPWAPRHERLVVEKSLITWKNPNNQIPKSQCSESCQPGSRKIPVSGIYSCCYECTPCSAGEMSNMTDSENCLKCRDDEWSNKRKDKCVPKFKEFLSYTNDWLAVMLTFLTIFGVLVTAVILGIFIYNRNTPIVIANNRNLSFILLTSIFLCFLCVFYFIGRPVMITCMLRQTSFGVIFSVAVSSVLAKTIMVCIAFKATKPGSIWIKWNGVKLSNFIILLGSTVQIVINTCWLAISPPFLELDLHSYQEKIIIQCNEGSDIAFYCVLGYLGLLAAVSFIIAFIARTLPDSFNEAKYITFSMLVFCSVWIAMIPAYLSTKGKYMVAVEIFAILTSNTGILGCIFLPKCYIIICRPAFNTKKHLLHDN